MPHVPSMMMIFEDETTIHNVLSDRKQILRKMLILPTSPPHPSPPPTPSLLGEANLVARTTLCDLI